MKYRIVPILFVVLLCFGCASQNNLVIDALKSGDYSEIENRRITIRRGEVDDWAYPSLEEMEKLFPGNDEYLKISETGRKYHGVKINLYDFDNTPSVVDETDGSIYVGEPDVYKVIAFFPYSNIRLEKKFKRLYRSKDYVSLTGKCLFVLPGEVWNDTQIQEDDMPVIMIQMVF